MKKIFAISLSITVLFSFLPVGVATSSQEPISPLSGKIIVLDAGHGGTDLGATYPPREGQNAKVYEKDINLATVFVLKSMLEGDGVNVVLTRECDEEIPGRKDRVEIAKQKCLDDFGGECDVLVSVHHNGKDDENHDGMMVIYNNREDFILAQFLHDRLLKGLFNDDSKYDEGYDRGGYGMTVYFTPASLTEGYYITNKCEAELFRPGTISEEEKEECAAIKSENGETIYNFGGETAVLQCSSYELGYNYGVERVNQEAEAIFQGLIDYFSGSSGNGDDDGNEEKCPPGWARQGKC